MPGPAVLLNGETVHVGVTAEGRAGLTALTETCIERAGRSVPDDPELAPAAAGNDLSVGLDGNWSGRLRQSSHPAALQRRTPDPPHRPCQPCVSSLRRKRYLATRRRRASH